MIEYGLPVLFVVLLWWFSTGVILFLDGLPRHTYRWSLAGATALLAASIGFLAAGRDDVSATGAYLAFTGAVLTWGWHEMSFLMGVVTGPRRLPLPEGCRGWRRFGYAVQTIVHHELAIAATGLLIVAVTWGGANQVGAWSFLILWGMRLSAKFNLFLGVRNWNEEFLPQHLRYLETYFARRPVNPLFPVSVAVSTGLGGVLLAAALAAETGSFEATALLLLATLLWLAVLEHWFMVVPLPTSALWSWGFQSRQGDEGATDPGADCCQAATRAGRSDRAGRGLRSWSTILAGPCDPDGLHAVLEAVVNGGFGDVRRVNGVARAGSGWVQFYVAGGRAGMAAVAAMPREEARVVAVGRSVDGPRLMAAFEACAVPVGGTA